MRSYLYPLLGIGMVLFLGVFVFTYFDIYPAIRHLDKIMHFSGGFAAAWFLAVSFQKKFAGLGQLEKIFLILGGVALIGVLWEFAEFLSNQYADVFPNFNYWLFGGDLADTIADLAFDLLGGIVLTVIFLHRKIN